MRRTPVVFERAFPGAHAPPARHLMANSSALRTSRRKGTPAPVCEGVDLTGMRLGNSMVALPDTGAEGAR